MAETKNCSSCGVALIGYGVTTFDCPNCGQTRIGRCLQCRNQSVSYTCTACGFRGP
ncbi:MAG: zinc finger domain-containing protein [Methanomassiliicoccales archaeon]